MKKYLINFMLLLLIACGVFLLEEEKTLEIFIVTFIAVLLIMVILPAIVEWVYKNKDKKISLRMKKKKKRDNK